MSDLPGYLPPVGLGDVMRGMGIGEVVESLRPDRVGHGMDRGRSGRAALLRLRPAADQALALRLSIGVHARFSGPV